MTRSAGARSGLGTSFTGFGPDLVTFYEGLAADNSRSWWQAHKDVYDTQVRAPLEALADDLAPRFGEPKIFRPHRDVRFSADKRPYNEHASIAVIASAGTALYLQISAEELLVAAGLYSPSAPQLARYRRAVDAGVPAVELDRIVTEAGRQGLHLSDGAPLKTAPRGFSRDHPRLDLLRRRSLTLGRTWEPAAWWSTTQLRDTAADAWTAAAPLNNWCARHVGPAAEEQHAAPPGR